MAINTPPKAEFQIDPTIEEYTAASLLAERQSGTLRLLPVAVFVSAGLMFLGLTSLSWFRASYSSIFLPLLLCVCCPFLLIIFFYIQPEIIKKRAARSYLSYRALMQTATLKLFVDEAVTETKELTLTDPYALMAGCIETPKLFVLMKDRERMLVIPKRCIQKENAEDIINFIRLVFARKRYVRKNWIF